MPRQRANAKIDRESKPATRRTGLRLLRLRAAPAALGRSGPLRAAPGRSGPLRAAAGRRRYGPPPLRAAPGRSGPLRAAPGRSGPPLLRAAPGRSGPLRAAASAGPPTPPTPPDIGCVGGNGGRGWGWGWGGGAGSGPVRVQGPLRAALADVKSIAVAVLLPPIGSRLQPNLVGSRARSVRARPAQRGSGERARCQGGLTSAAAAVALVAAAVRGCGRRAGPRCAAAAEGALLRRRRGRRFKAGCVAPPPGPGCAGGLGGLGPCKRATGGREAAHAGGRASERERTGAAERTSGRAQIYWTNRSVRICRSECL
jgi:hypothetical protein